MRKFRIAACFFIAIAAAAGAMLADQKFLYTAFMFASIIGTFA